MVKTALGTILQAIITLNSIKSVNSKNGERVKI